MERVEREEGRRGEVGLLRRLRDRVLRGRAQVDPADIAGLYDRSAREGLARRNPLIVIPGIMGSHLIDPETERPVWGDFRDRFARPWKAGDAGVIGLPMELGAPLDRLQGVAQAAGSLSSIWGSIGGLQVELRLYSGGLSKLGVGSFRGSYGSRSRHEPDWADEARATSFQFPYDWRRSLDETAGRLLEFMRLASRFVQAKRGTSDPVKFDVVAHSMGGLVLRYFLRYGGQRLPYDGSLPVLDWSGAAFVDSAILVGTPNGGSLRVLDRLVSGLPGNPIHPHYEPTITGTMPSLYQLIPRTRHRPFVMEGGGPEPDCLDASFWRHMRWGLADPDRAEALATLLPGVESAAERTDIALEHQEKCLSSARALFRALDEPAERPDSLSLHLVVGDAHKTVMTGTGVAGDGRIRVVRKAPGDGVVLRSSALLDDRVGGDWEPRLRTPLQWNGVTFIRSDHMKLIDDPVFIDNALFFLLEQPRARW
ncbi:MAG: hypothetical protein QNK03_02090 [Myxococcota bacterium]|nr:hypothetical protein [Myxococcota bacterium]